MAVVWYVNVRAKEGEEQRVRDGLTRLAAAALTVPGCLRFEVHQEAGDPRAFSIYEQWTDYDAHTLHTQGDHYRDIAQAVVVEYSEPLTALELELLA